MLADDDTSDMILEVLSESSLSNNDVFESVTIPSKRSYEVLEISDTLHFTAYHVSKSWEGVPPFCLLLPWEGVSPFCLLSEKSC